MEAKAIRAFIHANTGAEYAPGDVFQGTDEQAAELCSMGFVEIAPEPDGGSADGEAEPERELEDMTVAELKEICAGYGIPVLRNAKKENLVAAVRLYRTELESDDGADPEQEDGR